MISIFVLALLMMSVGVPVYDGLLVIENIGNLNVKTISISGMLSILVL